MDTVGDANDGSGYKTEQYWGASRLNAGVKDSGRLIIGTLVRQMTRGYSCRATIKSMVTCVR
jgi:hypothetical protein